MARQMRRRLDRGSISLELALIGPIAFVALILIITQLALWTRAEQTARSAAGSALIAAQVETGSTAAGQAAAEETLAHFDGGPLLDPTASVDRGAETVTVTVSGGVQNVIPFLELSASASATGPVEAFRPDTGAP